MSQCCDVGRGPCIVEKVDYPDASRFQVPDVASGYGKAAFEGSCRDEQVRGHREPDQQPLGDCPVVLGPPQRGGYVGIQQVDQRPISPG